MSAVRTGPVLALAGLLGLLAVLDRTVGLTGPGLLAGVACGLVLALGPARRPLAPADRVTLTRATLAAAVTALVVGPAPVAAVVPLAAVALVLDAVDGRVARRTGTASAFGARFDMEVDAFLILVLSVLVARTLGGWVLAIGLMRYANGAAEWVLPWLPGPVPPRYWRKVVAAVQGVVLLAAASGLLPRPLAAAAVAAALALLVESFGQVAWWRWRQRPGRVAAALARAR